jgi:hypothetical protein
MERNEVQDPQLTGGERSPRIVFCPTCKRPFLRGAGVRQSPPASPGVAPAGGPASPLPDPRERAEYCSEDCLPGLIC